MDKNVAVRVFRMERRDEATPRFIDVLRQIDNISGYENREKKLGPFFDVRLEVMQEEGADVVCGEITRIQTTNFPSELTPTGRQALTIENRLGHSIVFRANHNLGILAVEFNQRVCSPNRLFQYMQQFNAAAAYNVRAYVRHDAWERFNRGGVRKLEMTVANPSDLRLLEGPAAPTGTTLAAMAEAYGAPKITIAFSMGHAHGSLFESARGLIQSLVARSVANDVQVEKLRSYVEGESEPIDFLDELLIFRETLDLHDRDPDINFEIKRNYLRQVMHGLTWKNQLRPSGGEVATVAKRRNGSLPMCRL